MKKFRIKVRANGTHLKYMIEEQVFWIWWKEVWPKGKYSYEVILPPCNLESVTELAADLQRKCNSKLTTIAVIELHSNGNARKEGIMDILLVKQHELNLGSRPAKPKPVPSQKR